MKITAKKIVGLLLVVVLLATALVGCGGKKDEVVDGGGQTLTYWVILDGNAAPVVGSYDELLLYQEMEKKFNVDLQFVHPVSGQDTEQFNLMLASRDLTDVIETNWLRVYNGGPDKAVSDGIIISLNDLIEAGKTPNLSKLLEAEDDFRKSLMTESGDFYVFPSVGSKSSANFGGLFLRQDWLDELGLEVPETIDEWEVVLTAFKEKKGATTPFTTTFGTMLTGVFDGAYGLDSRFYIEDGKVMYGALDPMFKDYIIRMRDWVEKGLIDRDIFSNDQKSVDNKIVNNKAGASYGSIGANLGRYMTLAEETGIEGFNLVGAQFPVLKKGDTPTHGPYNPLYNGNCSAAISTKNTKVDLTAEILDFAYSEEGGLLYNFGVEGITYNMVDGYPTYTDLILKNPDGLPVAQAMSKHFRANAGAPTLGSYPAYLEQYYTYDLQIEALKTFNEYTDSFSKNYYPMAASLTPEESEEIATLQNDIITYCDEMITKFVIGTEPIEKFDEFVANLKTIGVERAIEIKQAAYDRYIKR